MHSNMLSTVVLTHSLPFWCSEPHPSMPSSCHLLSSCTNTRLGPPFLPESTTLTQQPSRFMNELMLAPMPPSHRQTNDVNLLHPCMLASPLQCMTPSARSGSLPLWYTSCQKTATKCTPVMVWSTAAQDDTFVNAVSSPLTLPQLSQWPPHISVPLPATAKPAQPPQPLPVAPAMPATPQPQTPAVPKVAPVPVPTSATPSISPVQPHRLGHTHTAPKHLIQ